MNAHMPNRITAPEFIRLVRGKHLGELLIQPRASGFAPTFLKFGRFAKTVARLGFYWIATYESAST